MAGLSTSAKSKIPPIVFFGTGPVAAKSLDLLSHNFEIEAIITKPRPMHHKGSTPVLDLAEQKGFKVLTANNSQELDLLLNSNPVNSKLAVLIDFGIIISKEVINYFPLGIVNSHFSILPDLRGADPITFAILSGQKQTGVSLMKVVEAMDEGPLFAYREYDLSPDINGPKLTDDLILLSDTLLKEELPRIFSGEIKGVDQSLTKRKASYSNRLKKEDGRLDWTKPAAELEREVRAYLGWPGSFTKLNGSIDVIITDVNVEPGNGQPGQLFLTKTNLSVQAAKDRLTIYKIKPYGKNEMYINSFIAGYQNKLVA